MQALKGHAFGRVSATVKVGVGRDKHGHDASILLDFEFEEIALVRTFGQGGLATAWHCHNGHAFNFTGAAPLPTPGHRCQFQFSFVFEQTVAQCTRNVLTHYRSIADISESLYLLSPRAGRPSPWY